jgi:hypothetical protein
MLSGATYGVKSIPVSWLRTLDRVVVKEIHLQVSALLRIAETPSPAPE